VRAAAAITLLACAAALPAAAPAGETACEKDVAFALPLLEKQCGALLRQKKVD